MERETLDFIADVHGRFSKLCRLMECLGYRRDGDTFVPPRGHRAVFLGDLIDTKPGHEEPGGVRATLQAVKKMADRGDALVILGNHELNALCYHTRGDDGEWLRSHGSSNRRQHEGTLTDFPGHADSAGEWCSVWMPWFRSLPLWLDLGGVRAVHACWHEDAVARLAGKTLNDPKLLAASAGWKPIGDRDGLAVDLLLKGMEAPLPAGHSFTDRTGTVRTEFRVRWWEQAAPGTTCVDLVFPADPEFPDTPVPAETLDTLPGYPADAPPLFIGHYFKAPDSPFTPEAPNLACLDHSAAKDGPLVAYRWRGEATITPGHYLTHE